MTAVSTTDKNKKGGRTTQTQFIGGDTTVTHAYTFSSQPGTHRGTAGSLLKSVSRRWNVLSAIYRDQTPYTEY